MTLMKQLFSPANLITVTGAVLTVIGGLAYVTGAANLSVPTLFYGFPIFLAGLALKSSELAPTNLIPSAGEISALKANSPEELAKLLKDVTRWRYGQNAHLESSLKALKLWDDMKPPQLLEIEELASESGYGIRLRFQLGGVELSRWQEKQERLGRFFTSGMQAELISISEKEIDLILVPQKVESG